MRKYLVASLIVCLFLVPPILGGTTITWRSDFWAWTVLMLGFGAFLTIYLKVNVWIKLISIYLYINCLLSQMPIASITSYHSYAGAFVLYLIFLNLSETDFRFIFKVFPILFIIEIMVLAFQLYDVNIISKVLDLGKNVNYGTVSNSMMFASMLLILACPLAFERKWYAVAILVVLLCFPQQHRVLAPYLAGIAFYITYLSRKDKFLTFILVFFFSIVSMIYLQNKQLELRTPGHRGPVWDRAIEMANDRPVKGWGLGTFKYIFPLNSGDISGGWTEDYVKTGAEWNIGGIKGHHLMWNRLHNFYIQFYWSAGILGLILLAGFIGWIIYRYVAAYKTDRLAMSMSGLIVMGLNMIETYPETMIQLVPVMLLMLAYFTKLTEVKYESRRV